MCKFENMQTQLLTSKICSWKFYFSIGIPRESEVHNCNRYGPPSHLLLWVSVGHLQRRDCLKLSLCCLLSRVLKTTLEGLERVLCSSENVVNLPKLAGLQYGQAPTSRQPWLVHRNMQRKDHLGVLGCLLFFPKILLWPFKLSYKILFTTLTVKPKHSSLTQIADPIHYAVMIPKEVVMSLTTWLCLKHTAVTGWKKGGERKLAASEKSQGPHGNQVSSPSCCRLVLENKNRVWVKCNRVVLDTYTWCKGRLDKPCSFKFLILWLLIQGSAAQSPQSQTKIKDSRYIWDSSFSSKLKMKVLT